MATLNIPSLFFNEDLMYKWYNELDIDNDAKVKYIDVGHPLDYVYSSPNQITTIEKEDNNVNQRVRTFESCQHYYQSEKARIFKGPELAEKVRLSKRPFEDANVPVEDYNKICEWEEYQFDFAFKCNWLKFVQNEDLARKLLRTGKRRIVAREKTEWSHANEMILVIIRDYLRRVDD